MWSLIWGSTAKSKDFLQICDKSVILGKICRFPPHRVSLRRRHAPGTAGMESRDVSQQIIAVLKVISYFFRLFGENIEKTQWILDNSSQFRPDPDLRNRKSTILDPTFRPFWVQWHRVCWNAAAHLFMTWFMYNISHNSSLKGCSFSFVILEGLEFVTLTFLFRLYFGQRFDQERLQSNREIVTNL